LQTNNEGKENPKRTVEERKIMPLMHNIIIKKENGKEDKAC
jgi:hypothetical protein